MQKTMKALVVDDSLLVRKSLKTMLESLDYEVILAKDGKEAIYLYKKERPDIVTMDLAMPEMDGIPALKQIMLISPVAKVIIATSNGLSQSVLEAIKNGALGYVLKPITIEALKDSLEKVFPKTHYKDL